MEMQVINRTKGEVSIATYTILDKTAVRIDPNAGAKLVVGNSYLEKDAVVTSARMSNGWILHDKGWSLYVAEVTMHVNSVDVLSGESIVSSITGTSIEESKFLGKTVRSGDNSSSSLTIDEQIEYFYSTRVTNNLKTVQGIHGLPYQFLPNTDTHMSVLSAKSKFDYGRKYTERILGRMPLLLLTPGKPAFLDGFTKAEKENLVMKMISQAGGKEDPTGLEELVNVKVEGDGRYYSFQFDYAEYYRYVNGLCWAMANLLGLQNVSFGGEGKTLGTYDWSTYSKNEFLQGFFSGSEYVPFYVDSDTQISESFSNNTGQSMLDSGLNKLSELGKEIDFMFGAGAGLKVDALSEENYAATREQLGSIIGNYSDPNFVIERLKTGLTTVVAGGQLIFPEIWKDSSFSKSYDINIKLASPDGDDASIYTNILVPLAHLMGFVVPQQMGTNGYRTPFMVRGFYRGIFNVDMGIITSMNIKKGGDGSWNINSLPTEMEISFTIKDLYEILTMTKYTDANAFVNNTPMMDFLANMVGVSINKPEFLRKTEMWLGMTKQGITNLPRNAWLDFSNTTSNFLKNLIR